MGRRESLPTILIVDDLEANTKFLAKLLEPKGFVVLSAQGGEEALEFVRDYPPDVILLDLMMPEMDGFEVCKRLKDSAATRHIPVIIITGLMEREANVLALEAGADDFVVKPFDSVLLMARIKNSLRSKMLQDQVIDYQKRLEEYNEKLREGIAERTAQLARTQHTAVFSLAKLAESRDTETGAHLERMRSYTRQIAMVLMESGRYGELITPAFVEHLFLSCPLHDIGKVGIPDCILLKPEKLSNEEFEIMKTHTVIGGDTLQVADLEAGAESFLAMGRDIAYYHHERWDGQGYPRGLCGEEIPLAARITAISDVYDALTCRRPYKEPFSHEKSVDIIVSGRGSQFDPDIVDAFLAHEADIIEINEGHREDTIPSIVRLNQLLNSSHAFVK